MPPGSVNIIGGRKKLPPPATESRERVMTRRGIWEHRLSQIASEHRMTIYVNGGVFVRLHCTPMDLPELVAGRLLTEGCIRDVSALHAIRFSGDAEKVYAEIDAPEKAVDKAAAATGETEDGEGKDREGTAAEGNDGERNGAEGNGGERNGGERNGTEGNGGEGNDGERNGCTSGMQEIRSEWIFMLADTFMEELPLYRRTGAVHSAMLMKQGEILFRTEDIGRHNALDKAIGYALLRGHVLRDCILYTSGRMAADLVQKAVAAGCGALAGKAVPTTKGLLLAREAALTMIGRARPDSFVLYNGSVRQAKDTG